MKDFAGYLSQYFKGNGFTYTSASKICGVDRTLLGRYASGARIPKKASAVADLAKGLRMSKEEEQKLLKSYERTRVCREYHVEYSTIEEILEGEHGLPSAAARFAGIAPERREGVSRCPQKGSAPGHARNLHSMKEVLGMVSHIMRGASWIKLAANPQYPFLREELQHLFPELPEGCSIEQMVGIGKHEWQHGEKKLKNLIKLLPLLLQKWNYQVYYHYQWEPELGGQAQKLDYALTDKGMVLFGPSLEMGFFTDQNHPCSYYRSLYDDRRLICRPFAKGGRGQYKQWCGQPMELMMENPKTGICFTKNRGENCVWMVKKKQKCAACIQEIGMVQFFEQFIWGKG